MRKCLRIRVPSRDHTDWAPVTDIGGRVTNCGRFARRITNHLRGWLLSITDPHQILPSARECNSVNVSRKRRNGS